MVAGNVRAGELANQRIGLGLRLFESNPGIEPGENLELKVRGLVQPVLTRNQLLLHRNRRPQIGNLRIETCPGKLAWSNTDDGEGCVANFCDSSQRPRVTAELTLPVRVTQHHNWIAAGSVILIGAEDATEHCVDSQGPEVIAGDKLRLRGFELGRSTAGFVRI